mgnify:CR=1 FL=1
MFEVLVYVYENYWRGDDCPEPAHLERKLNAVGFETGEIKAALTWLNGLLLATRHINNKEAKDTPIAQFNSKDISMRIYSAEEQNKIGYDGLGFLTFLQNSGALSQELREVVIDRCLDIPEEPVGLDDLKIVVLMVYWRVGQEPDPLVLDELCDDTFNRIAH